MRKASVASLHHLGASFLLLCRDWSVSCERTGRAGWVCVCDKGTVLQHTLPLCTLTPGVGIAFGRLWAVLASDLLETGTGYNNQVFLA